MCSRIFFFASLVLVAGIGTLPASAMDRITLARGETRITVEGRVVVEAQDGGRLLLARDGVLWLVQPDEIVEAGTTDAPFAPFTRSELTALMLADLPQGFQVHETAHYLIFHNTSGDYVRWCGSLFERLYMAFTNYWSRKGFDIRDPEFPLVAVIFADRAQYLRHAGGELGEAAANIIGYYNLQSNRMTMYDLTGLESLRAAAGRGSVSVAQILSLPQAAANVATVVHEATHQIAFNSGLHTRLSDCPLWFSEGIAVYFETPDVSSARGWRTIGEVNRPRLTRFHDYLRSRPADSLQTLVAGDDRFRNANQGLDAYAEAWALTYFLINQRREEYVKYLKVLSAKPPMIWDDEATRLAEFEDAFGPFDALDREFLRYIRRLR